MPAGGYRLAGLSISDYVIYLAVADTNPAFGIQLHHPRFLEFIGAPESARLLYRSPTFWIQHMDAEDAVAAAVNLQRDAGLMLSNLQILSQFVTSLQLCLGRHSVCPRWGCGVLRWVRVIPGLCHFGLLVCRSGRGGPLVFSGLPPCVG